MIGALITDLRQKNKLLDKKRLTRLSNISPALSPQTLQSISTLFSSKKEQDHCTIKNIATNDKLWLYLLKKKTHINYIPAFANVI